MTTPPALSLSASAMTRRLRVARLGVIRSFPLASGNALRVFAYGTDEARAIAAHLLQLGYDAAATGDRVTVTRPEPVEEGEVVAATVVEQDAPRQDLDDEVRVAALTPAAKVAALAAQYDEQVASAPAAVAGRSPVTYAQARASAAATARVVEVEQLPAGGQLRTDEHGARYWTAEEVAAERAEQLLDEVETRAEEQHAADEADREANAVEPVEVEAITDRRELLAAIEVEVRRFGYGSAAAYLQAPGREVVEEALAPAPRHWTREEVLDRLRATGGFDLVLGPDDTAYDLEVGDTMLGGVTLRYAYGEFPGTAYRTIVLDEEPAVDDAPREQPAPVEWSEHAGS